MLVVGEGWQLLPEVFLFLLKPIPGYWKVSIDVFVKVKVYQNNIFYLRLVNDERDPCPGSVVGDLRSIVEPNNLLSGDFTPGRRVHHLIRRFCSPGDQAGQVDHAGGLNKHLRPSHQTRHRIWEYFEVGSSHLWPWGGPRGPCGGLSTPGTRKVLRFPSQTESSRSKHLSQSVECSSTPAASRGCASRGSPQTCSGWEKDWKGGQTWGPRCKCISRQWGGWGPGVGSRRRFGSQGCELCSSIAPGGQKPQSRFQSGWRGEGG